MKILVMIDMQNDFITGSLGNKETREILPKVCEKIQKLTVGDNIDFVFTMDTHNENYLDTSEGVKLPIKHCIAETDGWKLPDALAKIVSGLKKSYMVKKSSFGAPRLPDTINDIMRINNSLPDEIELFGVCTDICVISNALLLKSFFPETEITVDSGCCAGTSPEAHFKALEAMKMCHINII